MDRQPPQMAPTRSGSQGRRRNGGNCGSWDDDPSREFLVATKLVTSGLAGLGGTRISGLSSELGCCTARLQKCGHNLKAPLCSWWICCAPLSTP